MLRVTGYFGLAKKFERPILDGCRTYQNINYYANTGNSRNHAQRAKRQQNVIYLSESKLCFRFQ